MNGSISNVATKVGAQVPVVIIGRGSLQTKLLAKLIERELSGCCEVVQPDNLAIRTISDRAVALIDIESSPLPEIESRFSEMQHRVSVLAGFNAGSDVPVNWLLRWPKLKGLFHRDTTEMQFLQGIKALCKQEHWLPRRMLSEYIKQTQGVHASPDPLATPLTRKELEILRAMMLGVSNADIAAALHVSQHTVKTHLYNLYRKIKVHNRVQAMSWAMAHLGNEDK